MTKLLNAIITLCDQSLLSSLYALLEEFLSQDRPVNSLLYEIQHVSDQIAHRARDHKVPLSMINDNCLVADEETINSLNARSLKTL